jgi:hypothetical protein
MRKIVYLLPIIVPLLFVGTIFLDAKLNHFDPWRGEQGLGTVGVIFISVVVGFALPIAILLGEKIYKSFKK